MIKMDCGIKSSLSQKTATDSSVCALVNSFPVDVVLSYHNHLPGLLLFCPQRLERRQCGPKTPHSVKKSASCCLQRCFHLCNSLYSTSGSRPKYDAKSVGRRLNKFLLSTLRQCVCLCTHVETVEISLFTKCQLNHSYTFSQSLRGNLAESFILFKGNKDGKNAIVKSRKLLQFQILKMAPEMSVCRLVTPD